MKSINKQIFHHPIGEGLDKMVVGFTDSYVTHEFEIFIHPNFSIQWVYEILEDALKEAIRKENRKL